MMGLRHWDEVRMAGVWCCSNSESKKTRLVIAKFIARVFNAQVLVGEARCHATPTGSVKETDL